jgi:large subunit ribosomal protein L10
MKTKAQKSEELKKAKVLLDKSQALAFADFTQVTAEDVRKLRGELKKQGANFLVVKKRLLGLLLKEKGVNANLGQYKVSVGTVFSEGGIETAAGPAYKFFSSLAVPEGAPKDFWTKHLLGGYDGKAGELIDGQMAIAIGKLPPRDVLLAQFLGMLTAPIRSFLYVLDQKAKANGPDEKVEPTQAQA